MINTPRAVSLDSESRWSIVNMRDEDVILTKELVHLLALDDVPGVLLLESNVTLFRANWGVDR